MYSAQYYSENRSEMNAAASKKTGMVKVDIGRIKELCSQSKIKWSGHASERIQQRGITREDVINCIMNGEIIEEYPDDWLNPSCLIFGCSVNHKIIHVVVGLDDYIHIITAYFPSIEKFENDLKTRRGR